MSWLKKIVSKIGAQGAEQMAEAVLEAMPTAQCLTAEPAAAADGPGVDAEDENPTKQRRYFVKQGRFIDHEEEVLAAKAVDSTEEITDRRPVDLKTLFPKLSLR
jgi:hypothetical protein